MVAKWSGSCHDSFIFHSSAIGRKLEENSHNTDDGIWLGDRGYALRPYLNHPISATSCTISKKIKQGTKKVRSLVEHVIGIWKRRFHVLHSEIR